MHYKNGREAKNGDKVVLIPTYGAPVVGILYDAVAGNDTCNGRIATISTSDAYPNLKEVLHIEDALALLNGTSAPQPIISASAADQIRFGNENPVKE